MASNPQRSEYGEMAVKLKQQSLASADRDWYCESMTPRRNDLQALRKMVAEAHHVLATTTLPEGRSERAFELLTAALALADNLLTVSPAATLGKKGGQKTAKRGPDYFRKIASLRKNRKGGRPRKDQ